MDLLKNIFKGDKVIWIIFLCLCLISIIAMLIVYGLIKILGYFSRDIYCLAFQFDLAFGVLLAAVGEDHPYGTGTWRG